MKCTTSREGQGLDLSSQTNAFTQVKTSEWEKERSYQMDKCHTWGERLMTPQRMSLFKRFHRQTTRVISALGQSLRNRRLSSIWLIQIRLRPESWNKLSMSISKSRLSKHSRSWAARRGMRMITQSSMKNLMQQFLKGNLRLLIAGNHQELNKI